MHSRFIAVQLSIAIGAALVLSVAPAASAEQAAATELPIEDCKLTSTVRSFNEGFAVDEDAASATGTLVAQALYVEFPDHPAGGPEEFWLEHLHADAMQAAANLETQSGGRLDVVVREPADWITMPKDTTAYPATDDGSWSNTKFLEFVTDAIAAAQTTIDFTGSDVIWVFYPQVTPLATRGQASNFVPPTPDDPPMRAITLPKAGSDAAISSLIVHETGHTFSMPDLYDTSPGGAAGYFGSWDPMSDSWGDGLALEAWEFAGWHVWRFGWIDDAQVRCLDRAASVELTLDAITRRGSTVIAVIPTGDHRAVVMESRKAERFDAAIVRPGVLVYVVDTTVESGEGPIRVGPRHGTEFPADAAGFADATLLPGDRYIDPVGAFTVTVTTSSEASDTVLVAPAEVPTQPPAEPAAQPVATGATPKLPATGTDPGGLVALSIGLLLAGTAAMIAWSRRRRLSDRSQAD